jgi:hypothetical protein
MNERLNVREVFITVGRGVGAGSLAVLTREVIDAGDG